MMILHKIRLYSEESYFMKERELSMDMKKTMVTAGALSAVAGIAFLSMKPSQQKKIERSLKKTTDQLSDIVDGIQEKML